LSKNPELTNKPNNLIEKYNITISINGEIVIYILLIICKNGENEDFALFFMIEYLS